MRKGDIVQKERTRTAFQYIKGCYEELESDLFCVCLMDSAWHSSFKHKENHFNDRDLQHWNRFA